MLSRAWVNWTSKPEHWSYSFAFLLIISLALAIAVEHPLPIIIPAGFVGLFYISFNPRHFYLVFFLLLPFSVELELPGGFGTDLPAEPLMLILTMVALIYIIKNITRETTGFVRHPITLMLILHVFWIVFASIFSTHGFISAKFSIAKVWYVLPFFFLPPLLLDNEKQYYKLFSFLTVGLLISVAYVMLRHASMGFSFDSINKAVRPIYRNHVSYGVLLVEVLPFYVYIMYRTRKWPLLKMAGLIFILLAIYLTYTRAAHISVFLGLGAYFVIKYNLAKPAIAVGLALILSLSIYLSVGNNYLNIAPDYNKAVEHKKFDNLVEATYKMEDISTVERFYRWIAGVNMVRAKPLIGFGPGTFYSEYKPYTVTSYKTYVSDNPDQSGVHNYYLMTAAEQGLPGMLIFLGLCLISIVYGERLYHSLSERNEKMLIMATTVCFVLILAVLLINDLLEAVKIGPFFFLCLSILVYYDQKLKQAK